MAKDEDIAAGCGLLTLAVLVIGAPLFWLIGSRIDYSDGHRDGVLQKFSRKGLICKTWEGELATEGLKFRGSADSGTRGGNVFEFTVDDAAVIGELEQHSGKKIRLHYRQTLSRIPWEGDTSYRVSKVELLE